MSQKYLEIEYQIVTSLLEAQLMFRMIELAKEAGYTHVKDNWGVNVYDEYTIDEAWIKFKPSAHIVLYIDEGGRVRSTQIANLNQFHGANISHLQVLKSAAGFYIGDLYHDQEMPVGQCWLPNSRDSLGYWATKDEAEEALKTGNYPRKF